MKTPTRFAFAHAITLAADASSGWQQILRAGTWQHPKHGAMAITAADLAELKKNFDARVRGFVYADYDHGIAMPRGDGNAIAAGEVKALELRADGAELWALYEPTPKAAEKIRGGEYRFTSADFETAYVDKTSGKRVGKVLRGFALTNRPFIEGMAPLQLGDAASGTAPVLFAEYPREAPASEIPMNLKQTLKLAESATDAEVEAAVAQLLSEQQTAQANATTLTEVRNALQLADTADGSAIATAVKTLSEQNTALNQAKRETEVDTLLNERVAGGYLTPAEKPHWRTQLLSDVAAVADGAKTLLQAMPKRVPLQQPAAAPNGGQPIQTDSQKLLDEKIAQVRKDNPGITYGDALILAEQELAQAGTKVPTTNEG
ncbi:phage protease [Roseisolibacter agri]|uniref:Mu-like prophage I protein n=1 Tax=Roseisolibacter agri TaxID=2014610 RepID=A0AA37Q5K6_9BACT|nr:phage protease [Roseisolibacter agri]GLC25072.1 hypothetical protein rosag_15850 [Roseisolibacter agri]